MKSINFGKPLKIYLAALMLTSVLFNSSCVSSKKGTKVTDNSVAAATERAAEADSVERERSLTMEEQEARDMERVTHWIIYDTSRGDTITKQPILAEGRTEERSRTASRREVESNDTEKGATTRNIESEMNEQTDIETEDKRETKVGVDGFAFGAILMGLVLGVVLVLLINRKKE